ncbi:WxcM-like domain-containing protein [Sphingobacterium multivorum]|uniref:WxcM-like domain-containing protein n=1 Tax=Sphingobacterium multivorum TaxID=28454 RepID=UPI00289C20BC|nr:WxcM-like domain-containing protein [Sphingobacterium multivorum]
MIKYINGGIAKDERGEIRFVNDFDMTEVKRFYIIKNADTELVRGWRGHRLGQRWFYVLSGSFSIDIVKIDDWDHAPRDLNVENHVLTASNSAILYLSKGCATAIRALEAGSELLTYADQSLVESIDDDYTFPLDYFINT